MTTHAKPSVFGGADVGADVFRLINRAAANTIIKERLVALGAGPNAAALPPFLDPIIRPDLEKAELAVKEALQKMITPRRFRQALTAYTAHNAQQEQLKNQSTQKELSYEPSQQ